MPALVLHVNGFLHKGPVFICYNGAEDLYEVILTKNHAKTIEEVKKATGVYFDELGATIDRLVERGDCSQAEYEKKIEESLKS